MDFELDFKMIDDPSIKLTNFGEYMYSNIIYFAPTYNEEFSSKSDIKISSLLKFFDEGHDIMIFGSKSVGNFLRKFVTEFGVDFDDYETRVKDSLYLHNYKEAINPDLLKLRNSEIVVTKNTINIPAVTKLPKNFILYEGVGMEIDIHNQYVFPILRADENSYSINPKTGKVYGNGEKIKLVTGYQARNNRRVVISGSTSLCSNEFYFLSTTENTSALNSPNASFCQDIINWNFQKNGVLKFENIRHQRVIIFLQRKLTVLLSQHTELRTIWNIW
jgi:oligosaccharyltransferase complex subunit beta